MGFQYAAGLSELPQHQNEIPVRFLYVRYRTDGTQTTCYMEYGLIKVGGFGAQERSYG
jgi:hypothetical protein